MSNFNFKTLNFFLFAALLSASFACEKTVNTDMFVDNPSQFNLVFRTNAADEQARLAYDMSWSDFSATALYAAPRTTVNLKVTKNTGSG